VLLTDRLAVSRGRGPRWRGRSRGHGGCSGRCHRRRRCCASGEGGAAGVQSGKVRRGADGRPRRVDSYDQTDSRACSGGKGWCSEQHEISALSEGWCDATRFGRCRVRHRRRASLTLGVGRGGRGGGRGVPKRLIIVAAPMYCFMIASCAALATLRASVEGGV
jgi:hypothetical protein